MFYGSSFFRVVRRVCLAAGLCALALPVRAAFYPNCSPDTGILFVPLDDCPGEGQNVVMTYSYQYYIVTEGGSPPNQSTSTSLWDSSGATVTINTGGSCSSGGGGHFGCYGGQYGYAVSGCQEPTTGFGNVVAYYYNFNVSFAPSGGDNAVSAGYTERGSASILGPSIIPPNFNTPQYTYSSYTNNPCNNGNLPNEMSSTVIPNYQNNTGSPQQLSNGQTLQPGQSTTNVLVQWPNGSTGTFNANNQNPNTGAYNNDYGYQFNLSNGIPIATITPPQNLGANSDELAYSNAGPIIWQADALTNPALATAAGDSAIVNGENNLQNALNNDLAGLSNLLSRPLAVNVSNNISSGYSNVWVMNWPTNFGTGSGTNNISISNNVGSVSNVWVQNWPTNIDTNSALGMTFANTNQAGNIVAPVSQQVTTLSGMVPNSLADNSGAAEEQDITITPPDAPQQVMIAMGVLPSTLSTTFSQIRGLIAWFIIVMLAIWNFVSLFRTIKTVSLVPQGQGPDTGAWAALGSNVVTALVVASAIVAVISTIPVFAVGVLAGELSFASGYSSSAPLNFFNQMGWGFQFLSQYLPIYLMFTAFGVRVVYYFGLEVLAFFACIVIKLLIGV